MYKGMGNEKKHDELHLEFRKGVKNFRKQLCIVANEQNEAHILEKDQVY